MLISEDNDRVRLAFIYDQLDDIQQIFPDKDFIGSVERNPGKDFFNGDLGFMTMRINHFSRSQY